MKTNEQIESLVEEALAERGWLATDEQPTLAVAHADPMLPKGWVRVSDDYATWGYGPAEEIAATIRGASEDTEYGELELDNGSPPQSSRDWPNELFAAEQLEEGTVNDNPTTLIRIETNSGAKFTAGPHGVSECALSTAFEFDAFYGSRDEALAAGGE